MARGEPQNPIESVEDAPASNPPSSHLSHSEDLIDLTGVDHDATLVAPALEPPRRARATSPELLPDPEEDYKIAVLDAHPEDDTLFTSPPTLPPYNPDTEGTEADAPEPPIWGDPPPPPTTLSIS